MRDIFPTPVDENQLFDTVLVSDDGSFRETGPGRAVASEPLESGSGSPRADSGPLNDDIIRNASSQPRDEAVAETIDTCEAPQGQSTEEPGTAGTSEEGSLGLYFSSLESPIDWDDSALANAWLAEGSVPPNSDMAVPQRSAMREHASRPSSIASTSCNCINRTIASVEQFKSSPNTAALTETTLAAYKMSIVDCEKLLSCAHCYASTSATMLVIMVSDKLIASYQRLYARGSRSWTSESPVDPIPFEDHVAGAADVHHDQTYPPRRMSLGEYPIDCEREWAHIMALLISLQLTRIRDLLERLRVRVLATDELQMQIIQQQETRLRHIMAHFQKRAKVFVP
ncbi:C6 zinc finger domain-containing protein [Lasiodiplodia theobromae]|uniref:C6 zinc finger domain-containing protein n=1 Tax=Lasiodiplodia theobromae TaxID=45133 RepID=UPI0015C3A2F6|nr:C6 zinc finger domain-containing protein [Lasiodiplodia theobromae]KAF4544435.1 C6 zinc finger domain-containing protein [Lasiodiplodia theobromae]